MLADQHPRVVESVRGEGLMLGLKCRVTNTDLVQALRAEHMLTVGAGDNVVRLLPPLIIEERHLDDAMEKLSRACAALEATLDVQERRRERRAMARGISSISTKYLPTPCARFSTIRAPARTRGAAWAMPRARRRPAH